MKTAMTFGFRRGSEYSKLNKYVILSLNSHHTSMRPFRATASSVCCFNLTESESKRWVQYTAVRFHSPQF